MVKLFKYNLEPPMQNNLKQPNNSTIENEKLEKNSGSIGLLDISGKSIQSPYPVQQELKVGATPTTTSKHVNSKEMKVAELDQDVVFCSFPHTTPVQDTPQSILVKETPSPTQNKSQDYTSSIGNNTAGNIAQLPTIRNEVISSGELSTKRKRSDQDDIIVLQDSASQKNESSTPIFTIPNNLSQTENLGFRKLTNLHYSPSQKESQLKNSGSLDPIPTLELSVLTTNDIFSPERNELSVFEEKHDIPTQLSGLLNDTQPLNSSDPNLPQIHSDDEDVQQLNLLVKNMAKRNATNQTHVRLSKLDSAEPAVKIAAQGVDSATNDTSHKIIPSETKAIPELLPTTSEPSPTRNFQDLDKQANELEFIPMSEDEGEGEDSQAKIVEDIVVSSSNSFDSKIPPESSGQAISSTTDDQQVSNDNDRNSVCIDDSQADEANTVELDNERKSNTEPPLKKQRVDSNIKPLKHITSESQDLMQMTSKEGDLPVDLPTENATDLPPVSPTFSVEESAGTHIINLPIESSPKQFDLPKAIKKCKRCIWILSDEGNTHCSKCGCSKTPAKRKIVSSSVKTTKRKAKLSRSPTVSTIPTDTPVKIPKNSEKRVVWAERESSSTEPDNSNDEDYKPSQSISTLDLIPVEQLSLKTPVSKTPLRKGKKTTPRSIKKNQTSSKTIKPIPVNPNQPISDDNSDIEMVPNVALDTSVDNLSPVEMYKEGSIIWTSQDGDKYVSAILNARVGKSKTFTASLSGGHDILIHESDIVPITLTVGDKCFLHNTESDFGAVMEIVEVVQVNVLYRVKAVESSEEPKTLSIRHLCITANILEQNAKKRQESGFQLLNKRLLKGVCCMLSLSKTSNTEDQWLTDKKFVQAKVEEVGGLVVNSLDRFFKGRVKETDAPPIVVLLATRPLRTKKYLMALALGIPIVSIAWIKQCYTQNKLLDLEPYRLANGESIILSNWMASRPTPLGLFKSRRFYVHGKHHTEKDWFEILTCADATLSDVGEHCDFILCETRPKPQDKHLLQQMGGVIVNAEYIVNCLIHQEILDPDSHPKFTSWLV
ncbi:hypothetical protein BC833DRAFT_352211 [Globomyces pollinis-pini]|nr:hypothetical protein BC833DRAFT_352211 [Globomyces pollinis-pini]